MIHVKFWLLKTFGREAESCYKACAPKRAYLLKSSLSTTARKAGSLVSMYAIWGNVTWQWRKRTCFVRDSADDIAFEQCEPSEDDIEDFDWISSHLVECKCWSRSGSDGSLKSTLYIHKTIADIKGTYTHADIVMGDAVYLRLYIWSRVVC